MTRHTRQSAQSVSLFPFLAVLVCAMGVLIFLLIVTTSRIRSESLARAAAELQAQLAPTAVTVPQTPEPPPADPVPPEPEPVAQATPVPVLPEFLPNDPVPPEIVQTVRWPDPDEPLRQKIQQLTAERDKLRQQEQQLAARLRSAKELAAREQALAARQQQAVKTQTSEAAVQAAVIASLEQQQKQAEQEIRRLGREIEQTRARVASAPSRFSLVAYDGASGTTRRPILIECTSEGIRFIPEDVMITEEDLIGFTEGHNPVLAGARSLTEYWLQHDTSADGKPPAHPPYVLLLVRQSGSLSYYVTRRLLEGLGQPYGYELLPDDFPLEPPAVDPQAQKVCRTAVNQLLDERQELLARLTEKYGAGREVRVGRHGFDLVELQESAAAGKQLNGSRFGSGSSGETGAKDGTGSTASASATATAGGTASGTRPATTSTDGSQKPDTGNSGQLLTGLTGGNSGPARTRRTASRPVAPEKTSSGKPGTEDLANLFGRPGTGSTPGTGSGSEPGAEPGLTSGSGDEQDAGAPAVPGLGALVRNPPEASTGTPAAQGNSGTLNRDLFQTGESENTGRGTPENGDGVAGRTGQTPDDLPAGSTPGSPESLADAFQLPRGGSAAELRNLDYAERNRTAATTGSSTALNQFSRPQSTSTSTNAGSASNGGSRTEAARGISSSTSRQTAGGAAGASGSSGTSSSGSSSSGSSGPSPFQSAGAQSRSRSGNGVEFPDFGAAMRRRGIGYERELTVALQADQALIGGNLQLRLGRGETATELSRQVLAALEQKVASWGEPPEGFYWVPRLRVQISPGGNLHYSRLREDIARWGLETSVEQRLDAIPDPAADPAAAVGQPSPGGIFSDR